MKLWMYKLYVFTDFCKEMSISRSTNVNEVLCLIASPCRCTEEGRGNYKCLSVKYK
jgi:hypothetical protein